VFDDASDTMRAAGAARVTSRPKPSVTEIAAGAAVGALVAVGGGGVGVGLAAGAQATSRPTATRVRVKERTVRNMRISSVE
jgi:hypothetical protein